MRQRPSSFARTSGQFGAARGAQPPAVARAEAAKSAPAEKRKLGFKDQRELDDLPRRIESLEARMAALTAAMNDPAFFRRDAAAITAHNAEVAAAQAELDAAYARWEALEG